LDNPDAVEIAFLTTEIMNENPRDAADARWTATLLLPWMRRIARSWDNRALYARLSQAPADEPADEAR
jgi:hypothetical protein